MRNCVTEFRAFLLRGNSIDLAVGIVIGVAFGAPVNAFVNDLITPIIAAIFVIAEGHDRGQLEARHVRRRERQGRAGGELTAVFGQLGGPMAGLAPLVGEMLGVERAPIEVVDDGVRHSVKIGDAIDFEIEDIVPFGIETGQPVGFQGMFHPVGSDLTIAEAKRSKINAFGIEYEGKTGLSYSEFSWAA